MIKAAIALQHVHTMYEHGDLTQQQSDHLPPYNKTVLFILAMCGLFLFIRGITVYLRARATVASGMVVASGLTA